MPSIAACMPRRSYFSRIFAAADFFGGTVSFELAPWSPCPVDCCACPAGFPPFPSPFGAGNSCLFVHSSPLSHSPLLHARQTPLGNVAWEKRHESPLSHLPLWNCQQGDGPAVPRSFLPFFFVTACSALRDFFSKSSLFGWSCSRAWITPM